MPLPDEFKTRTYLERQIVGLQIAIQQKEQEIKEYQETIDILLATIEKEITHEQPRPRYCTRQSLSAFPS